jgi:hypothetical protein
MSTNAPQPGQVIEDYTSGTGLTWDTLSSTIGTGEDTGVSAVTGASAGGIAATTDSSGNVTLTAYVPIVAALADLPGANLPTSTGEGFLVYVRGTGLRLWDPQTASWVSV